MKFYYDKCCMTVLLVIIILIRITITDTVVLEQSKSTIETKNNYTSVRFQRTLVPVQVVGVKQVYFLSLCNFFISLHQCVLVQKFFGNEQAL